MKRPPPPPQKRNWAEAWIVRLAVAVGAGAGLTIGFLWSKAQVHTLGTVVLRGDHRGMIVIGHAMIGAFVGALLLGLIAKWWLRWR